VQAIDALFHRKNCKGAVGLIRTMPPPIFPPLSSPLPALDWHARARLYLDQAINMPDIVNGQPNWPRYFLLAHAAELAIRSVLVFEKDGPHARAVGKEPGDRHDLVAFCNHAIKVGLKTGIGAMRELPYLSEIHKNHVARYPKSPGEIWLASEFDDAVQQLLADTWEHIRPTRQP
jgi:hypothetical protein